MLTNSPIWVSVFDLEKKVGNLSFSGDGRMHYQNKDAGAAR